MKMRRRATAITRRCSFFALRGFLGADYRANLDEKVSDQDRERWTAAANTPELTDFAGTRGQLLGAMYEALKARPDAELSELYLHSQE